jgi:hypothetical protein
MSELGPLWLLPSLIQPYAGAMSCTSVGVHRGEQSRYHAQRSQSRGRVSNAVFKVVYFTSYCVRTRSRSRRNKSIYYAQSIQTLSIECFASEWGRRWSSVDVTSERGSKGRSEVGRVRGATDRPNSVQEARNSNRIDIDRSTETRREVRIEE